MKFTTELENNGKLYFLDIEVTKPNTTFTTSICRKPAFTGSMKGFDPFFPVQYKQNLDATLASRFFNICWNYFNLHAELQHFTDKYIGIQLYELRRSREPHQ